MKAKKSLRLLTVTLTALMAVALNGCLINRAVTVRDQFCDFDSNFSLQFSDSMTFDFHQPVLLDTDVLWLADADPTETIENGNTRRMIFVLEKDIDQPDPSTNLQLELGFELLDGKYRLAEVEFDPRLNSIMNPETLDHAAITAASQSMCDTGKNGLSRQVEIDLSGQQLDTLPNRAEILTILGPPTGQEITVDSFTYQYRLKGQRGEPVKARFTVWFDHTGNKLARMDSTFSHFHTSTDFVEKIMRVQVKI
jgi:hypothetical protein